MGFTNKDLLKKVLASDLRAVSRLITLSENGVPRAREVQTELYAKTGNAHVIGITGAPGAGKSTLVDELARLWNAAGKRVAVVAIDPTSPFSGGAILGDRIRMARALEAEGIYVRSMATRGSLGGLSRATLDAVHVLDAAGFEIILVETVGVGQGEVDIVRMADTCVVLMVPGMGDDVQAIKAGILEIADVFVINKADRDGADILQKDLRLLLSLERFEEGEWEPTIFQTVATRGEGIAELAEAILQHRDWLRDSGAGKDRRLRMIEHNIVRLAADIASEELVTQHSSALTQSAKACTEKKIDPYSAATELLRKLVPQSK